MYTNNLSLNQLTKNTTTLHKHLGVVSDKTLTFSLLTAIFYPLRPVHIMTRLKLISSLFCLYSVNLPVDIYDEEHCQNCKTGMSILAS